MSKARTPKIETPADIARPLIAGLRNNHSRMITFEWDPEQEDHVGRDVSLSQAAKIIKANNPPFDKPSRTPGKKYHCEWNVGYNQYICDLVDA